MLKISSTPLVSDVLARYKIWADMKQFYTGANLQWIVDDANGIPCVHYQDIEQINQYQNTLVAIDCLTEGIHAIDYFRQYNSSNFYLIFSNGIWDKDKFDLGINYEIMHYKFFLYLMAEYYNAPGSFYYYLDKIYNFQEDVPYVFVSTIGNVRPERDHLVSCLLSGLKFDNYLLRYSGQDINGNGNKDVVKVNKGEFDPYTVIPELSAYCHNISQTLPINMYNQARFNLTVETDLSLTDEFFLTEKTIKNLICGMPFVIVSTPHFLSNLRDLGFQTYSELWDESYDLITDYKSRVSAIVELCNRLSNFNWVDNQAKLIQIATANRLNFLNLHTSLDTEFLNFNVIAQKII